VNVLDENIPLDQRSAADLGRSLPGIGQDIAPISIGVIKLHALPPKPGKTT